MTREIQELREAITRSRAGEARWRCPTALRGEIVQFAKERRQEGVSVVKIADSLGVSESGLNRWLQAGTKRLRPVRVEEPAVEAEGLVLVTPGGYRLEGLGSASAADLLRRLGC